MLTMILHRNEQNGLSYVNVLSPQIDDLFRIYEVPKNAITQL